MLLFTGLAAAAGLETAATVHELDNGLTVVLEELRRTDRVALQIAYNVGSRDEEDGIRGTAHLFEHLMFEGSANVPTNAFDEWLTNAGGDNNAWTDNDETVYWMMFPSGALDLALFLESDRLGFLDAGLHQDNLSNQQLVVLQERAEGYSEPNGRDWDALMRIRWPFGHPYHVPIIGTVGDIEGLQVPLINNFWRAHYRTRNAVLGLVGNFESDVALDRIEHWFSDVPDRGEVGQRPDVPADLPASNGDGFIEDDVEERTLYVSWRTVPIGHPDEPALELLAQILSGGRGTRFDDALYYDKPLSTDAGVFAMHGDVDGTLIAYASSPDTKLKKLAKVIDKQVRTVIKDPVTDAELQRARLALESGLLDQLERPGGRVGILVRCQRYYGDPNCLDEEKKRYDAVTADDVARVAQAYLRDDTRVRLSVVPRDDGASALKDSDPVELP